MHHKNLTNPFSAGVSVLLSLVLVFPQTAWAGASQYSTGTAAASPASSAKPSDGSRAGRDGIKVHGHWVIEVRDPDGTVVTHREFENALSQPTGASSLLVLLSSLALGQTGNDPIPNSAGWEVTLAGPPGSYDLGPQSPCGANPCQITQAIPSSLGYSSDSTNLTVSAMTNASGYYTALVLTGTVVASNNLGVGVVGTGTGRILTPACPPSNPSCSAPPAYVTFTGFTGTTLSSTISAVTGQTIAVTVTLTFS